MVYYIIQHAAQVVNNPNAPKWKLLISRCFNPMYSINRLFPKMNFQKKLCVSICATAAVWIASYKGLEGLEYYIRSHFTPNTYCRGEPFRVPEPMQNSTNLQDDEEEQEQQH